MIGCHPERQLLTAITLFLISFLSAGLISSIFCDQAKAGTETGEFCPDCPDWTNLEGWLAQRDAYERAQINGLQNKDPDKNANVKGEEVAIQNYQVPELITYSKALRNSGFTTILDARDPTDYRAAHLSGARNLYWKSTQSNGNLDPQIMVQALCKLGVNNSDSILIYGDTYDGPSYIFWALRYLGHERLSVLAGGIAEALGAGLVADTVIPTFPQSNFSIDIQPRLLINQANLPQLLSGAGLKILDARDFSEYGQSRLTNMSMPFDAEKMYDDLKIKDAKTLEDLLSRRGLDRNKTILVYGTPGAYSLFYGLMLMGYNATLLEGDWWSKTDWVIRNVK
jgi:thiosulfate/3-mercaptopyruvate sulfurtransferase